jgi:hypothetical protein
MPAGGPASEFTFTPCLGTKFEVEPAAIIGPFPKRCVPVMQCSQPVSVSGRFLSVAGHVIGTERLDAMHVLQSMKLVVGSEKQTALAQSGQM